LRSKYNETFIFFIQKYKKQKGRLMLSKFYKELEIQPNASLAEIKKAYRNLARKYHPDINKENAAEDKFKKINEAYDILTNDSSKQKYMSENGRMHSGFGQGTMDDLFRNFGGFGFNGFNGYPFNQQTGPQKVKLEVPLDVMIKGETITININRNNIQVEVPENCLNGFEISKKTNNIDLILVIVAAKNYSKDTMIIGNDIIKSMSVNVVDLAFGVTTDIDTPLGKVEFTIPENTTKAGNITVPNKGIPYANGIGNLIIQFKVIIPNKDELISLMNDKMNSEKCSEDTNNQDDQEIQNT